MRWGRPWIRYGATKHTATRRKHIYDTRSSRHWKQAATKLLALSSWQCGRSSTSFTTVWATTLWLHVKFNLISFTLRPSPKDLFTRTVTARLSACVASSWKYIVRSRFIWFALRWLKLLFRYITLTTISCLNECAWIKFELEHVLHPRLNSTKKSTTKTASAFGEDWRLPRERER